MHNNDAYPVRLPLRFDTSAVQVALLVIGMGLLLVGRQPNIAGDDLQRWSSLRAILEHGEITGSPYSNIAPLFAIPLYAMGQMIGHLESVAAYFNLVQFVIFGTVILILLAQRIGWPLTRITALLILMASMFPLHLGYFNAEVFTALFVTIGILLVSTRPVLASLILGLGVANTPATFPGLLLASIWMAWRGNRVSYCLLPLPAFALAVGENVLKFGNPILNPYLQGNAGFRTILPYSGLEGFSYPIVFGVLNILFSIGKGLIFFVPGMFAALDKSLFAGPLRPLRVEAEAMLVFLCGMILTYAKWWAWYGGVGWGPRFFLFAFVPASLLLAASFIKIRTLTGAVLFSAAVLFQAWGTIESVLFGLGDISACIENHYAYELLCWYTPEFSPLFRQFGTGFAKPELHHLPFAAWCAVTCILMCGSLLCRVVCVRPR